jgi:hypothetical protein
MELWIRSQDKEVLLNIKGIQYQNYKLVENETIEANILIGFYNYYDNEILGEYETKERALEVLTEIQNKINLINLGHDFGSPMIDLKNPTYIYQMPEK